MKHSKSSDISYSVLAEILKLPQLCSSETTFRNEQRQMVHVLAKLSSAVGRRALGGVRKKSIDLKEVWERIAMAAFLLRALMVDLI